MYWHISGERGDCEVVVQSKREPFFSVLGACDVCARVKAAAAEIQADCHGAFH